MMPESAESREGAPSSYPSTETTYEELLRKRFPALLSVIAGMVDVIGYLSLKLFTAHVTGNIVVIAAQLVMRNSALLFDARAATQKNYGGAVGIHHGDTEAGRNQC